MSTNHSLFLMCNRSVLEHELRKLREHHGSHGSDSLLGKTPPQRDIRQHVEEIRKVRVAFCLLFCVYSIPFPEIQYFCFYLGVRKCSKREWHTTHCTRGKVESWFQFVSLYKCWHGHTWNVSCLFLNVTYRSCPSLL